jgi:amino acid adenylation domain-containing protein
MTSTNPSSQIPPGNATALSAAKQALLERRLAKMRAAVSSPTIARTTLAKDVPVSFGQERMWFLNQFEPDTAAYNRPTVLHFHGPLDITLLERSLNEILRRHQVLRTVYRQEANRPVQEVRDPTPIEIAVIDLQGVPASAREAEAERLAREEVSRSFDLSDDFLLRARLIRFAADKHWLILTTHHIAFDGWSQGVLHDELAALYAAFRDGLASPLPELPLQYIDYATRQRDWAGGSEASRQLTWWKHTLEGAATVLELPSDHSRPSMQSMRGSCFPVTLSRPLTDALRDLAMRNQASLFMVLMAAWNVLLHRYTGQEDILVGFPIAGRTRRETETLIGLFMNTLPLRTNLAGNPKFRELLSRVREIALDAYANQDVPLQLLIQSMSIQRDTSRAPLFQHMFVLQNAPRSAKQLGELSFDSIELNTSTSKLDLTMELRERPEGLDGHIEYCTDLFDSATIERMVSHFITLLEGIVAAPDQRISQLPLLTEPERHQLLIEWNDTAVDYPRDKCVHELFEEQVERTPDSVAVVFEDQQLTYRQLNERANQLAHHLVALGVGPETLVGLCLERSQELVVGILGILKAGGAYVPLDVALPPRRLEFMLQDAAIKYLVTRPQLLGHLPRADLQVVCLDLEKLNLHDNVRSNLSVNVCADNLAYVMYTSGSTGRPKGVMIKHLGLSNYLMWSLDTYSIEGAWGAPIYSSYAFDLAVTSLFVPLLAGRSLVVFDENQPVEGLTDFLMLHPDFCFIKGTPAHLSILNAGLLPSQFQAVARTLVIGGEQLQVEQIAPWRLHAPNTRIFNEYGPTETVVGSCVYLVDDQTAMSGPIPIGRPIANTNVYLLDSQRQLVPIGVPGELYIGGAGLARGYLNRPDLTAERFIGDPFSDVRESRLYRTGDLCRWQADGNLVFIGRLDDQVKLRGYRIELGEIESVLNEYPDVAQSVVILREDRSGDKRLVAYYVPTTEIVLNHSELRSHLRSRLPDHMVPAAFVVLDKLPLTSNGKIDRRGLPAPDDSRPDLETHYVAPRTPIEQQLASIWAEMLGIEEIGIHDNFFALGGHSLLATRVIARIPSVLKVELPLRKLFEAPTIAELGTEIAILRSGGLIANSTALMRVDRDQIDRLPLSFAQQRLWLLEQMEGELTAYNMSSSWKLRGLLDVEALRRALEEIVQRHEPLRTTFAILDDAPVQVIQPSGRFELLVEDLSSFASEAQVAEIQRCCRLEAEKPFNLSADRMLRASLLHLADDEHLLLLTMHHIASDGWSQRVLWGELAGLYNAYCRGAESNLRELPVQYADYAIWQRSELEGQRLERLLQYWREQLKGVSPLELPTDHPRPARPTYRGTKLCFELPEALVSQLTRLSQTSGVTLQMTLLAAFQTLLSRYSGQHDIAVGVPVAGRSHADLEDLIGFFVNTIVLRTDLSADPTFQELLGRVRQVSLAAYDHQDLPFEKLVEELRPERQLSRSPLFQVMFQLQNFVGEGLALPNLTVSGLDMSGERDQAFSNLDIVLALSPGADGGIIANWSFNTALFKRETMCFLAESYRRLLEQVVEDTGTSLKHFALADARTPLYPLTLAQRDIWIDQMLHGDTPLYNIGGHVHLPGTLDIDRLRQSIQLLIQKHDSLRLQLTKSRDENGIPQQTIVPAFEVEVPLHDFRGEVEPLKAARRWMQQRFVQPFTLEGQPLFRYDVIRVADENHYWLIQYHHLIIDGWGIALLNRSLAELYTALSQGRAPDLQSPSYLDHVADYQSYLQSEQYGNHRSYWLQRYDSVPFPLLTSRTPDKGLAASDCYTVPLSRDLYQQLGILAKQYQASTFHVIIGALALYFARTQGRDEFVIGLPILNRSKAAFKDTAGLFTGVIPTRLQVKADATFGELLRGIAQNLKADYRRQRFPIGEINRAVKPATQHHQLYDIGLSYESHDYDAKFDTITSHAEPLLHGWEQTPLMLYVREFHAQADVKWDFVANRAYFSSQEIERLQGHLVSLLATLLTRAEKPIWQLPLLTEPERDQLLVEWNKTATDYPNDKCVPELFEEQVERTPDAVAVVFEEQQLSYHELNERANQLAHYLISLGVGPETLVGLCLERSAELVVAILGILKAGGAYVPLEADSPRSRLELILADARIEVLVTRESLRNRLPAADWRVVCLDTDAAKLRENGSTNPVVKIAADNLAYVIYTSGSTGIPKGVEVRHRSITRLVLANDYAKFGPDRVFLQLAPVSFDASTFELWGSLLHGAKLVLAPPGLPDFQHLEAILKRNRVTTLWLTATLFNQVIEQSPQTLSSVQEILTGGEALSVRHIVQAQAFLGSGVQLINGYGPTENTTFTTCYRISSQIDSEFASIPIGRPIANTQVYVLDKCHQAVPIGVPGELYIGGAGLARGYLNRPELTAEKFVANPFSDDANSRLYRTGDLCRWRADGNLEFLGRIDDQVKLRGYRIELGEIEAALNEHPSVAQGVVTLREDRPGDKRLVAYCVAASDSEPKFSELRSHLQQRLPDYMLPAAFVRLDSLPLTPNGKVNRRSLPAPDDSRPELENGYVVPRNPLEEQLVQIWCEVLQLERVGVHDNFFALGGHSLLAVRLFARIEKSFGRRLPLAVLFQHGTIDHLAELLVESRPDTDIATVLSLQPEGNGRPLFMMPMIGGGAMVSRALFECLDGRFPIFGLQLSLAPQNLDHFRDFRTTAGCLVKALRKFQPHGPYALAGFSYGGMMAFEVACQLNEMGEKVDLLAVIDTGPGRRGLDPQWNDRWTRIPRIAVNMPSWLREELRTFSARQFTERSVRKLRQFFRFFASKGLAKKELDDVFDLGRIPIQNRELTQALYNGFRDYIPRPYSGKLTLIRAQTGPLLSGRSQDLGWTRFASNLDIRNVSGNHETILHPPHVTELARQLSMLMEGLS